MRKPPSPNTNLKDKMYGHQPFWSLLVSKQLDSQAIQLHPLGRSLGEHRQKNQRAKNTHTHTLENSWSVTSVRIFFQVWGKAFHVPKEVQTCCFPWLCPRLSKIVLFVSALRPHAFHREIWQKLRSQLAWKVFACSATPQSKYLAKMENLVEIKWDKMVQCSFQYFDLTPSYLLSITPFRLPPQASWINGVPDLFFCKK